MFQYFKGKSGTYPFSHKDLNSIEDLYKMIRDNKRPIPHKDGYGSYDDFQRSYSFLNKDLLPYLSVSLEYDTDNWVDRRNNIKAYHPRVLIDFDFNKDLKLWFNEPNNFGTPKWNEIEGKMVDFISHIQQSYPYTMIKRSYSKGLHVLISYVLIGEGGEEFPQHDSLKDYERTHKKVFKLLKSLYSNLINKLGVDFINLDSCTEKIHQLMVMNYDPNVIYKDNVMEIYTDELDFHNILVNEKKYDYNPFKGVKILTDREVIEHNNEYITFLMNFYNNSNVGTKKMVEKRISQLISHYEFKLNISIYHLSIQNIRLFWKWFKTFYKGASVPLNTFESFYNYLEKQNEYSLRNPKRFVVPLKYQIKIDGQKTLSL